MVARGQWDAVQTPLPAVTPDLAKKLQVGWFINAPGDGELSPHNVPGFVKEAALGGDGVTCAGSELTADHPRARSGVWYVSARTTENPRAR